jgi:small-conductance mechanosensitive channel
MASMDADADAWIGAAVAIGIAMAAVTVLRFAFARRHVDLPPEAETRLRLVERLVYAIVLVVGIAIALSKFDAVRSVSRALLTSSAIAAAVVGFAARQTLANVVAGLMLAITQPLRIGDRVVFEEITGVVEDVTLSYTFLRQFSGERIAIPNEKLASGILRNDSLGAPPLAVEADVWIAADADVAKAVDVLGGATVAEHTPEGVRLVVSDGKATAAERTERANALRARSLARLHGEGMLPPSAN